MHWDAPVASPARALLVVNIPTSVEIVPFRTLKYRDEVHFSAYKGLVSEISGRSQTGKPHKPIRHQMPKILNCSLAQQVCDFRQIIPIRSVRASAIPWIRVYRLSAQP